MRFTFMSAFSRAVESGMAKYIPDFGKYKEIAEQRLQHKVTVLDYSSALIQCRQYWRPAYIVEYGQEGACVVFLPYVPETSKGLVLPAKRDQIRALSPITANQLELSKMRERGLCTEYCIHA